MEEEFKVYTLDNFGGTGTYKKQKKIE